MIHPQRVSVKDFVKLSQLPQIQGLIPSGGRLAQVLVVEQLTRADELGPSQAEQLEVHAKTPIGPKGANLPLAILHASAEADFPLAGCEGIARRVAEDSITLNRTTTDTGFFGRVGDDIGGSEEPNDVL